MLCIASIIKTTKSLKNFNIYAQCTQGGYEYIKYSHKSIYQTLEINVKRNQLIPSSSTEYIINVFCFEKVI